MADQPPLQLGAAGAHDAQEPAPPPIAAGQPIPTGGTSQNPDTKLFDVLIRYVGFPTADAARDFGKRAIAVLEAAAKRGELD